MQVLVSSFKFLIPQTSFGGQHPAEQLPGMGHPWGTFQPAMISAFIPVAVPQSEWVRSKSKLWQRAWETGSWGCSLCSHTYSMGEWDTGRRRVQKGTGAGANCTKLPTFASGVYKEGHRHSMAWKDWPIRANLCKFLGVSSTNTQPRWKCGSGQVNPELKDPQLAKVFNKGQLPHYTLKRGIWWWFCFSLLWSS